MLREYIIQLLYKLYMWLEFQIIQLASVCMKNANTIKPIEYFHRWKNTSPALDVAISYLLIWNRCFDTGQGLGIIMWLLQCHSIPARTPKIS